MNDPVLAVRQSIWQRIAEFFVPIVRDLGESPSERMWDRVNRLEKEVARLRSERPAPL